MAFIYLILAGRREGSIMFGVLVIVVLVLAAVFGANPVSCPRWGYTEKEMRIADRILDLEDQAKQAVKQ